MTQYKSILRLVCFLIVILSLIGGTIPQLLLAQSNPLIPVFQGGLLRGIAWSNNSQQFTFTDTGNRIAVTLESSDWIHYDMLSQSIGDSTVWPLQPTLTQAELALFAPFASNQLSFIYESPNQRYLVFARGEEVFSLTLADRLTHQTITLSPQLHVLDPRYGPDSFRVLFSADSSAFTVMYATDFSDEYGVLYVSGYASNISDAFDILIGDFGQNFDARYAQVEDLSENGKSVLLIGNPTVPNSPYSNERHLYLWDSESLDGIDITPPQQQNIKGAAFSPQTEDRLRMIANAGLIEYNRSTHELVVIRSDITADWVDKVYFSPTADSVAITKEIGGHTELYVVDLLPILLPTTPITPNSAA